MEAQSNSFAEITLKEDLTINPCPSKKLIPVNSKPRFTSLEKVQVVTLESKSTSPPARTGNLDLLVVIIYSTLSGFEIWLRLKLYIHLHQNHSNYLQYLHLKNR